ncbi:MAG: outer membrane beta-barrel family protein [Bacteroidia bacterium]
MKKYFFILASFLFIGTTNAQMSGARMNVGHFYGTIIDSTTNQSVPFAAVQLSSSQFDSVSQSMKMQVVTGQLTGDNGEFSFDKLSVMGHYTLQISAIGYAPYEQKVSFNIGKLLNAKKKSATSNNDDPASATSGMSSLINAVDIDLGNIKISPSINKLKTVTVSGEAPAMELKLDKKVFDVSKSLTTAGGTAEDVLRNVPAVNVDIDGNVTLRNSSPTIYVDGMPTTLTIDQIPADEIDKVEVITNPSAKYDASAGSGGIINIVLKKNRVMGYNGSLKAGVDERGKLNLGLNMNLRQGKVNVFGSLNYHQIDHITDGITTRNNLVGFPLTNFLQNDTNTMNGHFAFARFGVDYFMDNRNTLTVSGVIGRGNFNTNDNLSTLTDTLHGILPSSTSSAYRNSNSLRTFSHNSGSIAYKHLFPKEDETFTANVQVEQGNSNGNSLFATQNYYSDGKPLGTQILQEQKLQGLNNEVIAQADYSNPLAHKIIFSTGLQATFNGTNSINSNYLFNNSSNEYEEINSQNTNYNFTQEVYAGYAILSQDIGTRFSYQGGLRIESSYYSGQLVDSSKTFHNQYPFSLFPSAYMTYHLSSNTDLQFNYSRHVIRPSFYQLIPFIDYSDSLNLKQGNPNLKPQFTNSFELNYLKTFNKKNSLMFSVYDKSVSDLITSYQILEYNAFLAKSVIMNTYENANSANSYGFEVTSQNSLKSWLDITSNVNVYESIINGNNLGANLTNQQLSWFGKLNLTFKLPYNFSVQLMGNYLSKSIIPATQGGGRWGGAPTSTVQGFILPNYWMDAALKYDFLKNKAASLTLNVKDVFATAITASTSNTSFFNQTTSRVKDPQFFRLTFSYRFGQTDFSLFKRKNMNVQAPDIQDTGGGE